MTLQIYKIASVTVGSSGMVAIDLANIPQGYTDLLLKFSGRSTSAQINSEVRLTFNASPTTNYSWRQIQGNNSTATSASGSTVAYARVGYIPDTSSTTNTFGSLEIYIPNYTSSTAKSLSSDSVQENNSSVAGETLVHLFAGLWSLTNSITQVNLALSAGNFAANSTVTLYGIL